MQNVSLLGGICSLSLEHSWEQRELPPGHPRGSRELPATPCQPSACLSPPPLPPLRSPLPFAPILHFPFIPFFPSCRVSAISRLPNSSHLCPTSACGSGRASKSLLVVIPPPALSGQSLPLSLLPSPSSFPPSHNIFHMKKPSRSHTLPSWRVSGGLEETLGAFNPLSLACFHPQPQLDAPLMWNRPNTLTKLLLWGLFSSGSPSGVRRVRQPLPTSLGVPASPCPSPLSLSHP